MIGGIFFYLSAWTVFWPSDISLNRTETPSENSCHWIHTIKVRNTFYPKFCHYDLLLRHAVLLCFVFNISLRTYLPCGWQKCTRFAIGGRPWYCHKNHICTIYMHNYHWHQSRRTILIFSTLYEYITRTELDWGNTRWLFFFQNMPI